MSVLTKEPKQYQRNTTPYEREAEPSDILSCDFRIATDPVDVIGRLSVVTERYQQEGYLQDIFSIPTSLTPEEVVGDDGFNQLSRVLSEEEFLAFLDHGIVLTFQDGTQLYIDKYQWQSVPFVAINAAGYVGSARLIQKGGALPTQFELPTLSDPRIQIFTERQAEARLVPVEFSQFAKAKGTPPLVPIGLLRRAVEYSDDHGITQWIATTDTRVVRLLNGTFFNFGLPRIGPTVVYLGSDSTPILITIEDALQSAARHDTSWEIAAFLRGTADMPGFEWYHSY